MRRTVRSSIICRTLTAALSFFGIVWGLSSLVSSEAADELRDAETRLLHSGRFGQGPSMKLLSSQAFRRVSACDTHSQRALLLMEMPLVENALRAGSSGEFDRHTRSLEDRSRAMIACTPRQSFAWLVMFNLAILHGDLDETTFKLLRMSYETSPNEAWISVRRIVASSPHVAFAPGPLRNQILDEFQRLIETGFVEDAAHAYLRAPVQARELLQTRIERLDSSRQQIFSDVIQRLRG